MTGYIIAGIGGKISFVLFWFAFQISVQDEEISQIHLDISLLLFRESESWYDYEILLTRGWIFPDAWKKETLLSLILS